MADTTYQKKKEESLAKLRELVHTQKQEGLKKIRQNVETMYNGNLKGCKLPPKEVARRDMDLGSYFACLIEARIAFEHGNHTKENEEINKAFQWSEKLSKSQTNLEIHRAEILAKQDRRNATIKTGVKRGLKSIFLAGVLGAASIGLYKGAKAGINAMSSADVDREANKKNKVTQVATNGGTIINNNQTSINVKKNSTNQSIQQGGTTSGGTQRAHLSSPADNENDDTYTGLSNFVSVNTAEHMGKPKSRTDKEFMTEVDQAKKDMVLAAMNAKRAEYSADYADQAVRVAHDQREIHNTGLQAGVDNWRALEDTFECVEGMADSTADIANDVADTVDEVHRVLEGFKNMFNFRR